MISPSPRSPSRLQVPKYPSHPSQQRFPLHPWWVLRGNQVVMGTWWTLASNHRGGGCEPTRTRCTGSTRWSQQWNHQPLWRFGPSNFGGKIREKWENHEGQGWEWHKWHKWSWEWVKWCEGSRASSTGKTGKGRTASVFWNEWSLLGGGFKWSFIFNPQNLWEDGSTTLLVASLGKAGRNPW